MNERTAEKIRVYDVIYIRGHIVYLYFLSSCIGPEPVKEAEEI